MQGGGDSTGSAPTHEKCRCCGAITRSKGHRCDHSLLPVPFSLLTPPGPSGYSGNSISGPTPPPDSMRAEAAGEAGLARLFHAPLVPSSSALGGALMMRSHRGRRPC